MRFPENFRQILLLLLLVVTTLNTYSAHAFSIRHGSPPVRMLPQRLSTVRRCPTPWSQVDDRRVSLHRSSWIKLNQSKKSSDPSPKDDEKKNFLSTIGSDDDMFDMSTTLTLIGSQTLLVVLAVILAAIWKTPNFGLGPGISFAWKAVGYGTLMTVPLGVLAWILDFIEESVPALKDVTIATQRSVLTLMGSTFKPKLGLVLAIALGIAAGLGEEMLFRGVLQYGLMDQMGNVAAVGLSSIIFGLLHAVTPVYAFLATLASVYFGYLYLDTGNLAVPIITHALYDVCAIMYAHWCVANLSPKEQQAVAEWGGPGT